MRGLFKAFMEVDPAIQLMEDYKNDITFRIDASKSETLWAVDGGGNPIPLADGERIKTWEDIGIYSNDLIKYNAISGYPVYDVDAFPGGKPGVEFTNAFMEAQTVSIHPSIEPDITSIGVLIFNGGTYSPIFWVGCQNGYSKRQHSISGHSTGTPMLSSMILDQNLAIRNHWIDGTHNIIDSSTSFVDGDNTGIAIGQLLFAWHDYKGAYALNITIAELIIFTRKLTDEERIIMETYLQNKWGL